MSYGKALFVFAAAFLALVALSEASKGKRHEFKCLGQTLEEIDGIKDIMKQCKEEVKEVVKANGNSDNEGEGKKGLVRCFMSCKYRKMGVLTSDNKFDISAYNAVADKIFPEAAREGMKADVKSCADSMTETLTNDDMCKNHEGYQGCIAKAFMKNCKVEEESTN